MAFLGGTYGCPLTPRCPCRSRCTEARRIWRFSGIDDDNARETCTGILGSHDCY